jgi:dephospho-CoA kinase
MLIVGITGGIGSGKTTVCNVFHALGYPIYNADIEARNLTNSHPNIVKGLISIFGNNIYVDGILDRARVSSQVFNNTELLSKLNGVIHPVVANHFQEWITKHSNSPLVFKEAAILFESGANKKVDKVIAVIAPKNIRIQRVCNRDGVKEESVIQRISNQMAEKEMIALSDFVINNDEKELLLPQILKIVTTLMNDIKD